MLYAQKDLVNYVKNNLDSAIAAAGWTCINNCDYVYKIKDKFKIYVREKELQQFQCISNNEFSKYPSLQAIHEDGHTFVVACDSEWVEDSAGDRFILSWQFSFIKGDKLIEMVFVVANYLAGYKSRLELKDALSVLYCYYDDKYDSKKLGSNEVLKYDVTTIDADGNEMVTTFDNRADAVAAGGNINIRDTSDKIPSENRINICLLFHMGVVDISAFNVKERKQILKRLTSIQKGIVSLNPIKLSVKLLHKVYTGHKRIFPFTLTIRDTMCHCSPGHKSLKELGRSINYNKVILDDDTWIERMDELLMTDSVQYFEYAATDATVTLLYSACLYGKNSIPKITITAASAGVMYKTIANYLEINLKKFGMFDKIYRGLRMVKKGNVSTNRSLIPFASAAELEAVSINSGFVQVLGSKAYHGGYNGCSEVGYFGGITTYDYDLKNAYPTAMVLVPDVAWEKPIYQTVNDFDIADIGDDLFEDDTPFQNILASVKHFKFPENVEFPCIPVVVDGIPVYPQEYDADDEACGDVPSVVITGPELYLAWKLGASVYIDTAVILNTRYDENTQCSKFSLAEAVKGLVEDRNDAKAYAKQNNIKNYLPDNILKLMVNSGYGKIAQSVINKRTWNAYIEATEILGCSIITNAVSACFITAYIRCVLLAAQNQCVDDGYKVFSTTTDGFISNVPEATLKGYDLYGFKELMLYARNILSDNEMWEIKHKQDDLLNFSTRGNLSISLDGVLAHNGAKSPHLKMKECPIRLPNVCPNVDDKHCKTNHENCPFYKDREWLAEKVLTRTGKIPFDIKQWVTFKNLVLDEEDDFRIYDKKRNITMDFDFKREPIKESFYTANPAINGVTYSIACFKTKPYQNIAKYKEYRQLAKWISDDREKNPSRALLTEYDWQNNFWNEIERRNKPSKPKAKKSSVTKPVVPAVASGALVKKFGVITKQLTPAEKKVVKQIRGCLYAYRSGHLDIPSFNGKTANEIVSMINDSGITPHHFSANDYKNYGKIDRLPWELASGKPAYVKEYLKKLEPTLTEILNI